MSETKQEWRGRLGALMPQELEEFLEQGVNMTLSCLKPNGDPYNTICWYEWRDGYFWIVVRQRSRWAQYLKNDPRVAFTVATWDPYVKMQADGRAEVVEEANLGGRWVEITRRMSYRYLGPNGPTYLESTMKQPRWLFRIKPENMKTWHGVGWARRYWVDGTGGPSYEEAHALVEAP